MSLTPDEHLAAANAIARAVRCPDCAPVVTVDLAHQLGHVIVDHSAGCPWLADHLSHVRLVVEHRMTP